ncbi:hypothetical protein CTEN210_08957 [Chaetoceros tenuissimus]|uniref:PNPLA domain-containing protein n=1 Tax=Chaetoceros tenuissimus TaxID=426638 RepID=A0AAD3CUG4_9STRA|nr:hypothetical protein CTEN210_08957 [Chaetoceros tenuissimus]
MKWEVSHKKLVETFEEQYVKQNNTVDPNAEPLNILVLDGGGMKGYGGMQMLLTIQEVYFKERGRDLFQQFDFIAGTSVGGITALGAADLNANGWSTDEILSMKCRVMIDEAREKCFKSMSLKNIVFSNQMHCIPTTVCIAAVKERLAFIEKEETLDEIASRELEPLIARTYDYPKTFNSNIPLASSSSDMRLYQAMAATSVAPVVFDSVKTEVDGKERILGDGGLFQNCPMSLALDEVSRLYPTRPLGVILNIGYGPEEEALIHRTIDTARLVHPNLHYQRIAPHDVFKDFSPAETDIQVITDMERKVEEFIRTTPRVQNALKVSKKLLQSKPRCFGNRSDDSNLKHGKDLQSLNANTIDEQKLLEERRQSCNRKFKGSDTVSTDSKESKSKQHTTARSYNKIYANVKSSGYGYGGSYQPMCLRKNIRVKNHSSTAA